MKNLNFINKKFLLIGTQILFIAMLSLPMTAMAESAVIKKVWLEHNVKLNNRNAIKVHCAFSVSGMNGKKGHMNIWIKNDKGKWHNVNSTHKTSNGTSYFTRAFTPSYEKSRYDDFRFALYLGDLNMFPGKHKYYVVVTLTDVTGKRLAQSDYIEFIGTGSSNKAVNTPSGANRKTNSTPQKGNNIVKRWSTPGPYNGTVKYTKYANGTTISKTRHQCIFCHGNTICGVCKGTGGTYNSYTQLYYPCGSCLRSGKCKYCNGTGYTEIVTRTDKSGNGYAFANDNMGPRTIVGGQVLGSERRSSSNDKKTTKETKTTCPDCGGTRLWLRGTQPEYAMPVSQLIGVYNPKGSKCKYCGHYDKHWHSRCTTCKHYYGTTNPYR